MPCVMVVDDSHSMRVALREVLREEHEVLLASNGREALALYQCSVPDVVLLDLMMPGMHGTEVARRILKLDPGAQIVVLTVVDETKKAVELLKHGIMDYLVKPCSREDLAKAIDRAVVGRTATDESPDILCTEQTERIENRIRKAVERGKGVLLWGRPGSGKRTLFKRAVSNACAGRHISVEVATDRFVGVLRDLTSRFEDSVGAVCLEWRHGKDDITSLATARRTTVQALQVLDYIRGIESKAHVVVGTCVDIMDPGSQDQDRKDSEESPELMEIYVPSPSQRTIELGHFIAHFAQSSGASGAEVSTAGNLSPDALCRAMTREPRLDNLRFVRAASLRGDLVDLFPGAPGCPRRRLGARRASRS